MNVVIRFCSCFVDYNCFLCSFFSGETLTCYDCPPGYSEPCSQTKECPSQDHQCVSIRTLSYAGIFLYGLWLLLVPCLALPPFTVAYLWLQVVQNLLTSTQNLVLCLRSVLSILSTLDWPKP